MTYVHELADAIKDLNTNREPRWKDQLKSMLVLDKRTEDLSVKYMRKIFEVIDSFKETIGGDQND